MLEDSLEASLAEIVEEEVIMNEDSFFESKNYDKSPTNISNSFTKSKEMAQIDLDQPEIL